MKFLLSILIFCCSQIIFAQAEYPKGFFRSPLDIPLILSGSFGELRTNHFHSGIDIKTNGEIGKRIYAVADGYVSRIKVSPVGYGNAIYITHPNGFTSVYGHLDRYAGEIADFVKKLQYEKESFEIEIYPDSQRLRVVKGQVIAFSGNTGGSGGPHLHFEIRETASEKPVNPLFFGFDIKDNIPPIVTQVAFYDLQNGREILKKYKLIKKGNTYYLSGADTVVLNTNAAGIGIGTYDLLNGASNHNGIYSIKMESDGRQIFQLDFEKFSFNESRSINALIEYPDRRLQRLFLLPGNRFSAYRNVVGNGVIPLSEKPVHIVITVADAYLNISKVSFYLKKGMASEALVEKSGKRLDYDMPNVIETQNYKIQIPANAFYEPVNYDIQVLPGKGSRPEVRDTWGYSDVVKITGTDVPLHAPMEIAIKPVELPERLKEKAVIVRQENGRKIFEGNTWENGFLKAKSSTFNGIFYISADTIAPKINPVNISQGSNLSRSSNIRLRISDELSGIRSYRATIDSKWILMEYDAKNNLLAYDFDKTIEPGEHLFVLLVTDNAGNQSTIQLKFLR